MEGLELTAFEIISAVGAARSYYIEAIQLAKDGRFEDAVKTIELGDEMFLEGHHAHAKLIKNEIENGQGTAVSLLILHAEDQMMSAEAFKTIAFEFIDIYKRLAETK